MMALSVLMTVMRTTQAINLETAANQPVKTKIQQRKPPEPEQEPEAQSTASDNSDSASQNPLPVTPAERMPAMPE